MNKKAFIIIFLFFIRAIFLSSQTVLPYVPIQGLLKEIETTHFIIIFPEKFKDKASMFADYAEDIHSKLSAFMNYKPLEKTTIVISNETDLPNGITSPIQRNQIILYLAPGELEDTLAETDNFYYGLILHEYAHIMQLDKISNAVWFWRVVNGKLYFPELNTFTWYIEGFAVFSETNFSNAGRLRSNYNASIIREAALNDTIPSFTKLVYPVSDFPGNTAVYHYGARFLQYIYDTYGEKKFKEIFEKTSNQFWPFVFTFVSNFKTIYGKELYVLWDEWILHEKKIAKDWIKYNSRDIKTSDETKLTNFKGRINDFEITENGILTAISSYENDNYIYYTEDNKKPKKLISGYFNSLSLTNDKNILLYTKLIDYPDGFQLLDLFSYNFKSKLSKQLTFKERVYYVNYSKTLNLGLIVTNKNMLKLTEFELSDGKIIFGSDCLLPDDLIFISKPQFSFDNQTAVFSGKTIKGKNNIYQVNLKTGDVILIQENGLKPLFIDDENLCFISQNEGFDILVKHNISNGENYVIHKSLSTILSFYIKDNEVFYVKYTDKGEEVFSSKFNIEEKVVNLTEQKPLSDNTADSTDQTDYKIKNYNFARFLHPTIWGLLPYQLNDTAVVADIAGSQIFIPYFGVQLVLYDSTPLSWFSYLAAIGLDYLRLYPDNSLSLSFTLPFLKIFYSWNNWSNGYYYYYYGNIYLEKYNGRFPVSFSNSLDLQFNVPLLDKGNFFAYGGISHQFNEYEFSKEKQTNYLIFSENMGYYYINSTNHSTDWDNGVYFYVSGYQSIASLFDNEAVYLLNTKLTLRKSIKYGYVFTNINTGKELYDQNVYGAYTGYFKVSESFLGLGISTKAGNIDMKAFLSEINDISIGSAYGKIDLGINVDLYKKSHYWYFMTMGFKEISLKTYTQFLFLFKKENSNIYRNILFDQVLELHLRLFAGYGNINVDFTYGGAIGYRVFDLYPSGSFFVYINIGL